MCLITLYHKNLLITIINKQLIRVFVTLPPMNVANIQKLLFVITLCSALLLPVLLPIERTLTFILIWNSGTTISLLLLTLQITQAKQITLNWLTTSATILVAAIALHTTQSVTPIISLWGHSPWYEGLALYFVLFATTLVISQQISQTKQHIINTIGISAILVSVYCILQWAHLDPLQALWQQQSLLGRSFSVFDRPATAAQFLLISLPFVASTNFKKTITIPLIIVTCVGIATTGSRSSLIGLLGIGMLYILINKRPAITMQRLLPILLVTIGLIAITSTRFTQEHFLRSFASRIEIAHTAINAITHKPLGYGVSTFSFTSQPYVQATIYQYEPLLTKIDKAHSILLDLALQVGIPIATAIGLLWAFLLYTLYKTKQYILLMSIVGISICLLFDFASAPILVLIAIILGLVKHKPNGTQWQLRQPNALVVVTILLAIHAYMTFQYVQWAQASVWANRALQYEQINPSKALLKYEYAIRNWASDPYIVQPAIEFALSNPNYADSTMLDKWLTIAMHNTNRYDATTISLAGWRELQRGNIAFANQHFTNATHLAPFVITPRVLQLLAFNQQEDISSSKRITREIQQLLPTEWNDLQSNRRRILLKENTWLQEF